MSLPRADYLILTCEHGGNRVPARFGKLLSERFVATHRGYDPGALALARELATATRAPLFHSSVTRLLVELNRPLEHPQVFYLNLPPTTRQALLERYYLPYWNAVHDAVRRRRRVLHLSVHSFTPRFRGLRRATDVGLLFDPRRSTEARFCRLWRNALRGQDPRLRVHYNKPYRGTFPSLVDALRKKFSPRHYVGIQIEINQRFPRGEARRWRALRSVLRASFADTLSEFARATPGIRR